MRRKQSVVCTTSVLTMLDSLLSLQVRPILMANFQGKRHVVENVLEDVSGEDVDRRLETNAITVVNWAIGKLKESVQRRNRRAEGE